MKLAPGVPSHMAYRSSDRVLYLADSGNGRIAKLDTTSGTIRIGRTFSKLP